MGDGVVKSCNAAGYKKTTIAAKVQRSIMNAVLTNTSPKAPLLHHNQTQWWVICCALLNIFFLPAYSTASITISALRTSEWIFPDTAPRGQTSITMQALRNGHDGFQLAIVADGENLQGVHIYVPDDLKGPDGAILGKECITLFRQIPLKITVPTGMHPEIYPEKEVFDPLLPLSENPFDKTETRTHPFDIGRVGATGKSYLAIGDGACFAEGAYTGAETKHYVVEVESPGDVGEATFRWSDRWDGQFGSKPYQNYVIEPQVAIWKHTGVLTSTGPVALNNGISLQFTGGGVVYNKRHINYKNVSEHRFHKGDRFYFTAYKAQTVAIYGDLSVPLGQKPGIYSGTVMVEGKKLAPVSIPINLTVYDVAVPNKRSIFTAFGSRPNAAIYHAAENIQVIQKRYDEALHSHRLDYRGLGDVPSFQFDEQGNLQSTDWRLFDNIMGPMLDGSYWDDGVPMKSFFMGLNILNPGNTYYMTRRSPKAKAAMAKEIADHLKGKGWFDRFIVYCLDEPHPKNYAGIVHDIDTIKSTDPDWNGKFMVTAAPTHDSILLDHIDIWVPPTHQYDSVNAEDKRYENRFSRQDYKEKILDKGNSFWLYVANYPLSGSYMSYQLDRKAIHEPRLLKWASWYEGASGFLFWATTLSGLSVPNAYLNPYFTEQYSRDGKGNGINGDGLLLYPGDRNGTDGWSKMVGRGVPFPPLDGPLTSIRLKQIRDGLEDWELFILAEKAGIGSSVRQEMKAVYQAITVPNEDYQRTGLTSWSRDGSVMWQTREAIARMVEEATR